jgi:hypothetical protein
VEGKKEFAFLLSDLKFRPPTSPFSNDSSPPPPETEERIP